MPNGLRAKGDTNVFDVFSGAFEAGVVGVAGSVLGAVVDGPGAAVDGPGAVVNGPGAAVNGPGAAVDGPGAVVDGPGAAVNGPGAAVDGPGAVAVVAVTSLPGMGRSVVNDGRNLSSGMMFLSNGYIPVLLNPDRMFF